MDLKCIITITDQENRTHSATVEVQGLAEVDPDKWLDAIEEAIEKAAEAPF